MVSWIDSLHNRDISQEIAGPSYGRMTKIFRRCAWILVWSMMSTCFGLVRAQEPPSSTQSAASPENDSITIGPGDVIDLSVYRVPELLLKVRVDSNGSVSLPLIGDLKLAGLTVRDAQLLIASELVRRQLVLKPEVSIFVETFATQGITVSGQVNAPGVYPLMGPHRLFDAISTAGGFTPKAGHTVTILHKRSQDREQVIDLSGDRNDEQANVPIYPGDTIIVSEAGVVYVLGEVNKPGAFLMGTNTSISVMKAIAMAGSTTKVASLKHAVLIRKASSGSIEMEISLDDIYHGKSSDVALHPEDIVFVPLSNLKYYGAMGIQGAIQAAVYSVYLAYAHN